MPDLTDDNQLPADVRSLLDAGRNALARELFVKAEREGDENAPESPG